ncbi:hypothetical protein [Nocardia huaxiensis]|uniref:hypothetical protein n=1 Tax=Nocardia huaxiensis TaxID=2755382 RepID=UPI001E2C62EF|nr:hypothetical protein [Nocardia huaxiensis]UFS97158.1 hypothetical protein LPY97_04310 [Nocardia huaxiensis]
MGRLTIRRLALGCCVAAALLGATACSSADGPGGRVSKGCDLFDSAECVVTFDRHVERPYVTVDGKKVMLVALNDDEVTVEMHNSIGTHRTHRVRLGGEDGSLSGYHIEVREITAEHVVIVVIPQDG